MSDQSDTELQCDIVIDHPERQPHSPITVMSIWSRSAGNRSWARCEVLLNDQVNCCAVTKRYLDLLGVEKCSLPVRNLEPCTNNKHTDRAVLSFPTPDKDNPKSVPFCVLDEDKVFAVMSGREGCFAVVETEETPSEFIAPIARERYNKGK